MAICKTINIKQGLPNVEEARKKLIFELDKAMEFDTVYVVSGPVFLNNLGTIGADSVTIPGYFYKIILRFENNSPKIIAFLIPQVAAIGELKDYVVPVNALESITGIDFFPAVSDTIENKVESTESLSQWGL